MTRQKIWWKAYFAALGGCVADSSVGDPEFCVSFAEKCADLTVERFTSEAGFIFAPLEKSEPPKETP